MIELADLISSIQRKRKDVRASHALLAAVSGIDGSGKGYIAGQVVAELRRQGVAVAPLGTDSWQNPVAVRIDRARPAETFYERFARLDEMFDRLVLPLQRDRAVRVTVEQTRMPQNDFFPATYEFADIDVIVLEGAYLLKRQYRDHYDLSVWIECTFETALERALRRNQEGQSEAEIRHDYATIYFPAQELHFARDDPRGYADYILNNDPRLER
jgi:uridine kinase